MHSQNRSDLGLHSSRSLQAARITASMLCFFATQAAVAASPVPSALPFDDLTFISPNRQVDVDGGRTLNLLCIGNGSPTLVFDAGLGDQIRAWSFVLPELAKKTRTCAYDRAGLGFSDASGRPGTAENAAQDLQDLLHAADIQPPYVLVGHSLGGLYSRMYASRFPLEVAGLVLVDPVSEFQGQRYTELDPSTKTANDAFVESLRTDCIPASRDNYAGAEPLRTRCVGTPDDRFSPAFNTAFLSNHSTERYMQAAWSEWVNVFDATSEQMRRAPRDLGSIPLIVLTRAPGKPRPTEAPELRNKKNALWFALHDAIAKLSTRSSHEVVGDTSHYIQFDQPEAVINAVSRVLALARLVTRM